LPRPVRRPEETVDRLRRRAAAFAILNAPTIALAGVSAAAQSEWNSNYLQMLDRIAQTNPPPIVEDSRPTESATMAAERRWVEFRIIHRPRSVTPFTSNCRGGGTICHQHTVCAAPGCEETPNVEWLYSTHCHCSNEMCFCSGHANQYRSCRMCGSRITGGECGVCLLGRANTLRVAEDAVNAGSQIRTTP
jgi:hypothetical protein